MRSSENGIESSKEISQSEENVINFLDSMDTYLILVDSLSSALRQGWFELASARQSMGASRVNSALFDLKSHHASTTLQVDEHEDIELPHFTLCKWASSDDPEKYSEEAKFQEDELLRNKSDSPRPQQRGATSHCSEYQERSAEIGGSPVKVDNHAERERFKSLSVFGALVSPKLRATQSSFEKALEIVVEISNVRSSLLRSYDQVHEELKNTK
ncbi:hypothetical protein ACJIZ3_000045 [Penstemon smallii]|uniref:Vacuolar ATPase assembly protein VMA22 n=1 Tax=Penstemon smallii TaxID=265156 RepID=A0ABD3RCV5_9LAMI